VRRHIPARGNTNLSICLGMVTPSTLKRILSKAKDSTRSKNVLTLADHHPSAHHHPSKANVQEFVKILTL
jgi:hypothetical protein